MENCPYAAILREQRLQFWLVGNVLSGHGRCSFLCEKFIKHVLLLSSCRSDICQQFYFFSYSLDCPIYQLLSPCSHCYCYCSHFTYEYCKVNKSQSKPVLVQMHKIRGNQVGVPSLILIDVFNSCLMRLEYGSGDANNYY